MARTWATTRRSLCVGLVCVNFAAGCSTNAQSAADRRTTSMKLNDKELSSLLQAVVDATALQPYLHPEQPGRTPLKVVAQVPGTVELRKFGRPVVVTSKRDSGTPALELTDIRETTTGWSVDFRYPPEGISGRFDLVPGPGGGWTVQRHELQEK